MTDSVDVSDLYKLARDMERQAGRLGADAAQVLRDSARAAEEYQRGHMPSRTGATRASVGTDYAGDGRSSDMTAAVGPTTDYWRFQEYGTVDLPANPIVQQSGDAAATVLALGLDDILKEFG